MSCLHPRWGPAIAWKQNKESADHSYWGRFCIDCHSFFWSTIGPDNVENRETKAAAKRNQQWLLESGLKISDGQLWACRFAASKIFKKVRKSVGRGQSWLDYEDFEQIAREALVKMAQKENVPTREAALTKALENKLIDWLRINGPRKRAFRVCPSCNHTSKKGSVHCEKCDSFIDLSEFKLERPIGTIDETNDFYESLWIDRQPEQEEERQREEDDLRAMDQILDDLVSFLPPSERKIINAYRKGWSTSTVSERTGVTENSAWVIRARAIKTLRSIAESAETEREPTVALGVPKRGKLENGLSPREIQVLSLASLGFEVTGTARQLTLSIETVKSYRKSILRSLGAKNLNHAIRIGFERGILPAD